MSNYANKLTLLALLFCGGNTEKEKLLMIHNYQLLRHV